MPELPEVETVKNALKEKLVGRVILSALVYWDNIIAYPSRKEFEEKIKNQRINFLERRGKFILFVLDDYILISHLRMEGKYYFKDKDYLKSKHNHVIFTLDNDTLLVYDDTRKFGKMYLIEKDKIDKVGPLSKLGCEPFSFELNVSYLRKKYKNKKLPIKTVLLDQSIITGIGNIYADEILYLSKINPLTKALDLMDDNLDDIITNTRCVLNDAISLGGTSIHSYKSVDGISGKFQNCLLVHGKEGSSCNVCMEKIVKIKVGGRGTYYCPNCQKLKK